MVKKRKAASEPEPGGIWNEASDEELDIALGYESPVSDTSEKEDETFEMGM
jgi:hypothetical protein